jgi:fructosamine-3-kinase
VESARLNIETVNEDFVGRNLPQLLGQVFGNQLQSDGYQIIKQKRDYLVLHVRLRRPPLEIVVKLAGPTAPIACPFDRTALLHQLVANRTSIVMPEILAVDVSYQSWPFRYMIKEYIRGSEWSVIRQTLNQDELQSNYREIGAAVAQLHQIHFPAFGEIHFPEITSGDIPQAGFIENDRTLPAALGERAAAYIKDPVYIDFFLSVLNRYSDLFLDVRQASLCHEDLHGYNILFSQEVQGWRLATILDFDKAWAGHSESDLARLDLWRNMTSPAFWEAYTEIHSLSPSYQQRRAIYQLFWCLEFAQPTQQHLADTRLVCRELGVLLPKEFE